MHFPNKTGVKTQIFRGAAPLDPADLGPLHECRDSQPGALSPPVSPHKVLKSWCHCDGGLLDTLPWLQCPHVSHRECTPSAAKVIVHSHVVISHLKAYKLKLN